MIQMPIINNCTGAILLITPLQLKQSTRSKGNSDRTTLHDPNFYSLVYIYIYIYI